MEEEKAAMLRESKVLGEESLLAGLIPQEKDTFGT